LHKISLLFDELKHKPCSLQTMLRYELKSSKTLEACGLCEAGMLNANPSLSVSQPRDVPSASVGSQPATWTSARSSKLYQQYNSTWRSQISKKRHSV